MVLVFCKHPTSQCTVPMLILQSPCATKRTGDSEGSNSVSSRLFGGGRNLGRHQWTVETTLLGHEHLDDIGWPSTAKRCKSQELKKHRRRNNPSDWIDVYHCIIMCTYIESWWIMGVHPFWTGETANSRLAVSSWKRMKIMVQRQQRGRQSIIAIISSIIHHQSFIKHSPSTFHHHPPSMLHHPSSSLSLSSSISPLVH